MKELTTFAITVTDAVGVDEKVGGLGFCKVNATVCQSDPVSVDEFSTLTLKVPVPGLSEIVGAYVNFQ